MGYLKKLERKFLLNINNLNSIIRKDENKNDDVTRTFHPLDYVVLIVFLIMNQIIKILIRAKI